MNRPMRQLIPPRHIAHLDNLNPRTRRPVVVIRAGWNCSEEFRGTDLATRAAIHRVRVRYPMAAPVKSGKAWAESVTEHPKHGRLLWWDGTDGSTHIELIGG